MDTIWEDLLEDTSFSLYAIHSNLEDHTLAYHLNRYCGLKLSRDTDDLEFANEVAFPLFRWKDEAKLIEWTLLVNKAQMKEDRLSTGLFPDQRPTRWHYLIPEKRAVDYFLKIEGDPSDARLLSGLREMPNVMTAYGVDPDELKSKHNLIF